MRYLFAVSLSCIPMSVVDGFVPLTTLSHRNRHHPSVQHFAAETEVIMDGNQKANLFESLLRDLQIEGVPLLGVDADQVYTLQAAMWTTMAELSEQQDEQKACLIFESTPLPALKSFVNDFMMLKTQDRLMKRLPELDRFSLSMVGKGAGPAILIESAEKKSEMTVPSTPVDLGVMMNNAQALKKFVDRMVASRQLPGYPPSENGVSEKVAPMVFHTTNNPEVCHILSSFWNCLCELSTANPDDVDQQRLKSTMLSLPDMDLDRAAAVAELLSRSLGLFNGNEVFELLHFHPAYDRNKIVPPDKPASGHVPPLHWIRPMLRSHGNTVEAESLDDESIALMNYLRRAPTAAVCIAPVELLQADLTREEGAVLSLDLGDGLVVQARGIAPYVNSVLDLTSQGEKVLQSLLEAELKTAR